MQQFSRMVEGIRRSKGMTFTALGEALGISRDYVSKICKGQRVPPPALFDRMTITLGVSLSSLAQLRRAYSSARGEALLHEEFKSILHCLQGVTGGRAPAELMEVPIVGEIIRDGEALRVAIQEPTTSLLLPREVLAVKVSSSALEPFAPAGSSLLVSEAGLGSLESGALVIVEVESGAFLRRLYRSGARLILAPAFSADSDPPLDLVLDDVHRSWRVVGMWLG